MPGAVRARVEGDELVALDADWEAAPSDPGAIGPGSLEALSGLDWMPASVPGTAAAALRRAGVDVPADGRDLDERDWWFRTRFHGAAEPEAETVLRLGGIATVADVYLNRRQLLHGESMFLAHEVAVGDLLEAENELLIHCRALAPLLGERRRPRARWRTQLADGNLRFFRTMLLGRAPGFAPGPAAVGPWRPVELERRRRFAIEGLRLEPRLAGADGGLEVGVRLRPLSGERVEAAEVELDGPSGRHRAALELTSAEGAIAAAGRLDVAGVAAWWPHTHGEPSLHDVRLRFSTDAGPLEIAAGRVGFRDLKPGPDGHDVARDGLDLRINGVTVFARGAVWTPIDPIGLAPSEAELRAALEAARDAGMNMLRLPGTGAYESGRFHDLCDELGILVWQDFAFANFDYPIADAGFRALVVAEAEQLLAAIGARPSTAVLCGNSEVEQQVAMLGLDPDLGRGELFGEILPGIARASGTDAVYVPSAPSGGELPFRTDRGIANYYGVGGYRRPIADARRAAVRFAAECLALANVPGEATIARALPGIPLERCLGDRRWKAAVARDVGSEWDFEDVRDHYLETLFGLDPAALRDEDPERYLELSRAVSGELMAEVFGEWRRRRSGCGGGMVLWLRDLIPGAGWGLFDAYGEPKVALAHLRRALAPVAVWTVDEGLDGIVAHIANDRPGALRARLRIGFYRNLEQRVDEVCEQLELPGHGACERDVEALLGRFVDASYAYRFGPPQQDAIVASLESAGDGELLGQSFRFPAGRPLQREPAAELGLRASTRELGAGISELTVTSRRLAYGVRIHAPGLRADDDAFSVEPGVERRVRLRPTGTPEPAPDVRVTALNLDGAVPAVAGHGDGPDR